MHSTEWVTIALGITIAAVAARISVAWIGVSMDANASTDASTDASTEDPERMAPVYPLPLSRKRRAMSGGGEGASGEREDTIQREHEKKFEPASIGPCDIPVEDGKPVDVANDNRGDDWGREERKGRDFRNDDEVVSRGSRECKPSISRGWYNAWNKTGK